MKEVYPLNHEAIDIASERIVAFLKSLNIDAALITKNRLLTEQTLLVWMERTGAEAFTLSYGVKAKQPYLTLQSAGNPLNVLEDTNSDDSFITQSILHSMGLLPSYSYHKGQNILQFHLVPAKKRSQIVVILTAIVLGLAVGLGINYLLPGDTSAFLLENLINPLYSTVFRLLGYISGPLILFSVTWGIYGIGDAADFKFIGKSVLLRYLAIIFLIAAVVTGLFPLFHLASDAAQQNMSGFLEIVEMVLDIIPSNIIEPLYTGNTLQIIFTAVLLGMAMIFLRKRVSAVADMIEQTNYIVQFLMECISKMLPYFIFLIMLRLVLSNMLPLFASVWKLFLLFLAISVCMSAIFTVIISIKFKVSPLKIIKKSLPTFLIAFTTASSSAAFASNMETCKEKFGIDESLCSFGLPLGMVMCKTCTVAYYVLISLFFAKQFDVAVSAPWVITVAFVSAMLAIATPPIPGGGTSAYTMLFAKLLIPDDALAIVLSVDIIFDFFRTAFNMYNLPLILINSANALKKLDRDCLRASEPQIADIICRK